MPLPPELFVPEPHALPSLRGLKLHLLGIRGIGMRTVGMAAQASGAIVDGCDRRGSDDDELARRGIRVANGHDPSHVVGRRLVATTVALRDNSELQAAVAAGTAHHRSDLLAALLRGRPSLGITGTHGKGTVAALAGMGLVQLGEDPMLLLGVPVPELGSTVRIGTGRIVAEVDESDGSVARVATDVSVVTNVSFDHPQYRRSVAETLADLEEHVAAVPREGRVVLGSGRAVATLARAAAAPVWRLGKDFRADIVVESGERTTVAFADPEGGVFVGDVRLRSVYLAENAALAYAALRAVGRAPDEAAEAVARLQGLSRRFEEIGTAGGVTVYDDYGKHPDCIGETLTTLRASRPRRLHALYAPHRVAHVRRWHARFAAALAWADHVVVLPIDDRDFGGPGAPPPDWFRRDGLEAELATDADDAIARIADETRPGDVVCLFGVHDTVAGTARALCELLRRKQRGATEAASERSR